MTSRLRYYLVVAGIAVGCQLPPPAHAQLPPDNVSSSNASQAAASAAKAVRSPIEDFRDLLAMSVSERDQFLADRSPENRRRILAKIQEYEAMKPEDRELRLRITEMRWHLLRLMALTPSERDAQINLLPEADRKPISDRLQQWDRLSANAQVEILKYESTMEQFAGKSPDNAMKAMPLRPDVFINLNNFLKMPPEKRGQICASFQQFFEMTDAEKQATLDTLPEREREEVLHALQTLQNMSSVEQSRYFTAFKKFSALSDAERDAFQKNAQRWQTLTIAEQEAWRNLVHRLPALPPMPPADAGFPPLPPLPQPPAPPLPPGLQVNDSPKTNSSQ